MRRKDMKGKRGKKRDAPCRQAGVSARHEKCDCDCDCAWPQSADVPLGAFLKRMTREKKKGRSDGAHPARAVFCFSASSARIPHAMAWIIWTFRRSTTTQPACHTTAYQFKKERSDEKPGMGNNLRLPALIMFALVLRNGGNVILTPIYPLLLFLLFLPTSTTANPTTTTTIRLRDKNDTGWFGGWTGIRAFCASGFVSAFVSVYPHQRFGSLTLIGTWLP